MRSRFHRRIASAGLCGVLVSQALSCGFAPAPSTTSETKEARIQRGAYLANLGGCHDCHSPKVFTERGPEPDPARLLSGHPPSTKLPELPAGVLGPDRWGAVATPDLTAWAGPWGVSFAANLTPDATGLGSWTEEVFIQAIRSGKHMGAGRPILPPMPWAAYAQLTDDDLGAIFAYLESLKPIANQVPQPIPPAPAGN